MIEDVVHAGDRREMNNDLTPLHSFAHGGRIHYISAHKTYVLVLAQLRIPERIPVTVIEDDDLVAVYQAGAQRAAYETRTARDEYSFVINHCLK
jgi:hypothetical protein